MEDQFPNGHKGYTSELQRYNTPQLHTKPSYKVSITKNDKKNYKEE